MGATKVTFSTTTVVSLFSSGAVDCVVLLVDGVVFEVDEDCVDGFYLFAAPIAIAVTQTATTTRRESAMESVRFSCNFF
jgi:hypothetical protein